MQKYETVSKLSFVNRARARGNRILFVEALIQDAMRNPDQLKNLEDVWDKEWTELLSGVDGGDEI